MSEISSDTTRKPKETKSGLKYWGYKSRRELARENITDGMTGLLNRKGWDQKVMDYIKHTSRTDESFVFVGADLDNLKEINDSLGHKAGDEMLIRFSKITKDIIRDTDILARLGGDEFGILLTATSLEEAENVKQRIIEESAKVGIKLSIGLGESLQDADSEMYKMKAQHKNVK